MKIVLKIFFITLISISFSHSEENNGSKWSFYTGTFDFSDDGKKATLFGIQHINDNLYRECSVKYDEFYADLSEKKHEIKFSDLELIFKNLKGLFQKQGYVINWKEIEKQSLDQTINTLSMASPFSLEEKQVLLESKDLNLRKEKLEEILNTYILDNFNNKTLQ